MYLLPLLLSASPASAGGLGVDLLSGVHQELVWFYGAPDDPYLERQERPTLGGGIEALLGDRDDRLLGLMRFYVVSDAPPSPDVTVPSDFIADTDEAGNDLPPDVPVRKTPRPVGVFSAGVQWGIWGDPTGAQLDVLGLVGAGALTPDSTEFLLVELGPGAHVTFNESLQLHAELLYQFRYRKRAMHGGGLMIGARYLFD